ncbi:hypothetical protein ATY75_12045 [Rhizobium sp. N122]|uniref:hypothetical protein n=1 Tax=Rhizobium sp. N122 TaxID=1764272 RepID=UPI000B5AACDB|nr:hypothetical protein [Rhizobium sp. N122]OWV62549.1 hypothetical protein ATY75_12045 [Rhizobium sp. N122]
MLGMEASSFAERHSMDHAALAEDPLLEAIVRYRQGMSDFAANAPDDLALADAFAEKSYRPARRILVAWSKPAVTFVGAVSALKMAKDADLNDDSEVVSAMVKASLAYFESVR